MTIPYVGSARVAIRAEAKENTTDMALVGTYRGRARPFYGNLLVTDPSMSGADEPDLSRTYGPGTTGVSKPPPQ